MPARPSVPPAHVGSAGVPAGGPARGKAGGPAPARPARDQTVADVTAVLVAHDGAAWLPEVLRSLQALTVRPRHLVAVDTGSTDGSRDLLRAALGDAAVLSRPARTGYGAAVAAGLAAAPAGAWVWLLHDDAAPAPDALEALLEHAEQSPSAAVLGPKASDWSEPRVLVEVGVTTDQAGHRETGLERREHDQGQHDAPRDVLAVGTAGALVRRDVWDALGGLDPALPLFRDELDLGWRVNAAGHRVVVVPRAQVRHVRAATTGRRSAGAVRRRAAGVDRRHALFVLLAHCSGRRLLLALPGLVLGSLLRALGYLLTRQLRSARDELVAVLGVLGRPGRLLAARRARSASRTVPHSVLRPLLSSRGGRLRARAESLGDWVAGGSTPGRADPFGGLGDVDVGDAGDVRTAGGGLRALLLRPAVLVVLGLALAALLAERTVLAPGGGLLAGGRLLPAPDGASDLWAAYAASWQPAAVGSDAPAPPALAVLALLSTVLLGKPWLAIDLLLLASVPLAGGAAYLAARRVVASRLLQGWAAATWALLPVATGAIAAGRLGVAAVQIALPLLLVAGRSVLHHDPRGSWHRAVGLGLGLAAVTALAPLLWPLAAVLLLGGALLGVIGTAPARRASACRRLGAAALVVVVPPLLLLPWTLEVVRTPGLLLHGPGPVAVDPGSTGLSGGALALLSPGGAGLPPAWVTAGLLLAALAGLVRLSRRGVAIAGWATALVGLVGALLLARSTVGAPASGAPVPVWPGVPLQVAAAGLLLAALVAADGARERLARSSFGWRQLAATAIAVTAAAVPVLSAASWVIRGADDPLRRGAFEVVPAFVTAELQDEPGLRALVLDASAAGPVRYELLSRSSSRLGTADVPPGAAQLTALDNVVADLLSARGSDAAAALSTRAVRYVALRPGSGTAAADALDAQQGLTRRADEPVLLWEVFAPTARLSVLPPALAEPATTGARAPDADLLRSDPPLQLPAGERDARTDVPPGADGRLLVLAEAADEDWQAELDGRELPRSTTWGWAQGFVLPADGGRLELRHDDSGRRLTLLGQGLGVLAVAVLAVPAGRRGRGLEPAGSDEPDLPPPVRPGRHAARPHRETR